MTTKPKLLFLCGGRRVDLLERFRRASAPYGGATLLTTDTEPRAATTFVADATFIVPPCGSAAFVEAVIEICKQEKVAAVLPLTCVAVADLPAIRSQVNARILSGNDEAVQICADKLATTRYLQRIGVPTPAVVANPTPCDLPLFFRLRHSEGSRGAFVVDRPSLLTVAREYEDGVLTRFTSGREATVDIYRDFSGRVVCTVPRARQRVRGGEVERATTLCDDALLRVTAAAIEGLTFVGPATLQAIHNHEGWQVVEINLRYAGGVTLSMEAGMDSPSWLVGELCGAMPPSQPAIVWGLGMSRCDREFYYQAETRFQEVLRQELRG